MKSRSNRWYPTWQQSNNMNLAITMEKKTIVPRSRNYTILVKFVKLCPRLSELEQGREVLRRRKFVHAVVSAGETFLPNDAFDEWCWWQSLLELPRWFPSLFGNTSTHPLARKALSRCRATIVFRPTQLGNGKQRRGANIMITVCQSVHTGKRILQSIRYDSTAAAL